MNSVGLHVFAQLRKVLPMDTFEAIAAKYPLKPCNSRKFTPRDYFTAMLFGQLSGASSLREVVLGMAIAGEKIVHTGAKFMKRTTLAYNNNHSNPLIFKDFYFAVLEQFRCELGHKKQAQFDKPLFSIDSSTISLGCKLYGWANFRRHKKGIKVHTGLSNELGLPEVVVITVTKKADVRAVIEQLPQEAIIVMDRGYNDYRLFNWIDKRNTVFVTRLKKNAAHTPLDESTMVGEGNNWSDYHITFTGEAAKEVCGEKKWRVVRYFDTIEDRWFEFITNDFDSPAETIAELYRERWKVELFFKKLKQNTVVKAYFGTTENAVRSQVWIALIATLLLQILFQRSRNHRYFSTFNWVVRQSLWKYIRLEQILNSSILGRDEPEASCEESPQMELPFGKVGPLKPKICVFSFKSTNYFFDAQIRFGQ